MLSGFKTIEVVDLDTIDVSNLNRQFLFRRHHVGKSKAEIAAEAVKRFNKSAVLTPHCANIKDRRFGATFMRGFDLIFNALDNIGAFLYLYGATRLQRTFCVSAPCDTTSLCRGEEACEPRVHQRGETSHRRRYAGLRWTGHHDLEGACAAAHVQLSDSLLMTVRP